MKLYNELMSILDKYKLEDGEEDSYSKDRRVTKSDGTIDYIELNTEIAEVLNRAVENEIISEWTIERIGGFSSPGYVIDSYALVYVQNGHIELIKINYELY